MWFDLVTGFFEVMLELLLRVPPTPPDGPYLLSGRRSVRVLVRATVAGATSGIGVHKGIVPPGVLLRKRKPAMCRPATGNPGSPGASLIATYTPGRCSACHASDGVTVNNPGSAAPYFDDRP